LASKIIHAAGGIVCAQRRAAAVRCRAAQQGRPLVLPRGKLKATERAKIGARREVVEETGHRVDVRQYLGAITYRAQGRPKVVQFWCMQAAKKPSHDLMKDIAAVDWLPLKAAVRRLSYPLEKLFLKSTGRQAIPARKFARKSKPKKSKAKKKNKKRRSVVSPQSGHKF